MHIGDYRHRVIIQKKNIISDEKTEGVPVESWDYLMTTWAAVMPLGGKETFVNQALQGENPYMFRMRYKKNIDNTMRLVYLGKNFRITNINDVNSMHREMQITCMQEIENG
jgi:SPP1 family predicted phage head-tail adaptor